MFEYKPFQDRQIRSRSGVLRAIILLLVLSVVILVLSGCSGSQPEAFTENDFALGTTCSVKLFGARNKQYLLPALDVAKEVERIMSVRLPDSEITRINDSAGAGPVPVSPDTYRLLQRAYEFSDLSGGVFDLTVGPLVALWDIGSGDERVPEETELRAALDLINYRNVVFDMESSSVGLAREGMRIDLGAIAKGYAADRIVEFLRSKDVQSGIVNLGGNVYAFGEKPGGSVWKIGIQSPNDDRGSYIGILETRDRAVVTSGKYERYFLAEGRRYHHILNTEDGYPIENGLASVSIVSSDATAADALSTLVFGLGLQNGLQLAESLENIEAILVTDDNIVYTTSGLRESFTLTDNDFQRGESRHLLGS